MNRKAPPISEAIRKGSEPAGMGQHLLVGDGEHDDPGDDRDMAVGVGGAPDQAGSRVVLDHVASAARADIEIDPPHG